MRYIKILLILCLLALPAFAADTMDYRICDGDGHCLQIASDGSIYVSVTIEVPTITSGAHDIRVSDADGHVLDIGSNGAVTVKVE